MEIKIFVEGVADRKFIEDYIKKIYNTNLEKGNIILLKGKDYRSEMVQNRMSLNTANEGVNLVILDADNDFQKTNTELEDWKKN